MDIAQYGAIPPTITDKKDTKLLPNLSTPHTDSKIIPKLILSGQPYIFRKHLMWPTNLGHLNKSVEFHAKDYITC